MGGPGGMRTDLSSLLETGLNLDVIPESNTNTVQKKTTGKNFPRANRSPRAR